MIRSSKSHLKKDQKIFLVLSISVFIVFLVMFLIGPMIASLILAFYKWSSIGTPKFIGLENFKRLFTRDHLFMQALYNTLLYTLFNLPISLITSLLIASLLNNVVKFKSFFRVSIFLPVITPMVACAIIWKWLYQPSFGLFNYILQLLNLHTLMWLESTKTALISVAIMSIWKATGYRVIILLSAMQSIPTTYLEAAEIDGATRFEQFIHIKIPMIFPTVLFVSVTTMMGCLKVFEQIYIMTEGGPLNSTRTIVYHLFTVAFRDNQMGYGSAVGIVLLVLVAILTYLQLKISKGKFSYE